MGKSTEIGQRSRPAKGRNGGTSINKKCLSAGNIYSLMGKLLTEIQFGIVRGVKCPSVNRIEGKQAVR
jgi:hypothetical protein